MLPLLLNSSSCPSAPRRLPKASMLLLQPFCVKILDFRAKLVEESRYETDGGGAEPCPRRVFPEVQTVPVGSVLRNSPGRDPGPQAALHGVPPQAFLALSAFKGGRSCLYLSKMTTFPPSAPSLSPAPAVARPRSRSRCRKSPGTWESPEAVRRTRPSRGSCPVREAPAGRPLPAGSHSRRPLPAGPAPGPRCTPKRSQRASRRAVPSGGGSAGKRRGAIGAASGPPDLERAAAAASRRGSRLPLPPPLPLYGVERSAPQESRGESPHSARGGGEENTRGVAPAFPERRSCRPAAPGAAPPSWREGNPCSRPAPSRTAPRSLPSRCCPLPVPRGSNPPRAGAVRRGRGRGALEGRRQRLRDPRRLPLALRRRRRRRRGGGDADAAGQQRQQHHVGSGRRRGRPRRGQRPPGPGESLLQGVSAGAEGREGA